MNQLTENPELRFVLLFHQYSPGDERADHWDLMLEHEGQLLTWALSEELAPGKNIVAKALDDHRIEYLDYEGEISNDRGSVSRVSSGEYRWKQHTVRHVAILDKENENETWEVEFSPFDGEGICVSVSSGSKLSAFS